jgi:hypothetical protein
MMTLRRKGKGKTRGQKKCPASWVQIQGLLTVHNGEKPEHSENDVRDRNEGRKKGS